MAAHAARGEERDHAPPAWGKLAAIALVIVALLAVWRLTPLRDSLTGEAAVGWAHGIADHWWAPLLVIAAYTPACLVMFPRPVITLTAVIAFGPWWGGTAAIIGVTVAALATYWIGTGLSRETVRRLAGGKLDRIIDLMKQRGLLTLTLLRLVPLAPFAIEGIVAGSARFKVWHLALATALGMLPGTLALAIAGTEVEAALSGTGKVNWWLIAGPLVILAVGTYLVKRWFTRMESAAADA